MLQNINKLLLCVDGIKFKLKDVHKASVMVQWPKTHVVMFCCNGSLSQRQPRSVMEQDDALMAVAKHVIFGTIST